MKVSIIIANYNHSRYLNRSIRSAFVQNFEASKYEIIVVDDGSSDWSKEIMESYGKLIRKIYVKRNGGLAAARNVGIRAAKGKYIIFLDADDFVHRDLIYIESMFLDLNPEWVAVAVDYNLTNDHERTLKRINSDSEPIACGIMYRKTALFDVGLFDENYRMHEDKELRVRFSNKYLIHRIPLPLYRYRRHGNNMTSNKQLSSRYLKILEKAQANG